MLWNELLEDVIAQKTFKFGEPWRLGKETSSIVVPILKQNSGKRSYVVIEEVKERVQLADTGGIGEVKARNLADGPVFVRSGSALSGRGVTQSRGVSYGTILFPQLEQVLTTVCIYASKGIITNALFCYAGLVPRNVHTNVAGRNQAKTWESISDYGNAVMPTLNIAGDDLVSIMDSMKKIADFKEGVEDFLSKIPADLDGQVGLVILDANGVVGLELFDHEDSWRAFSKSIARTYREQLTKEEKAGNLFDPKADTVVESIARFLKSAMDLPRESVFKEKGAETFVLNGGVTGEYTLLDGDVIHVILVRKECDINPESCMHGRVLVVRG